MSIGTIILIILVIALLGGFSGIGGGPFYGTGYYGGGGLGLVIVILLILLLMGRLLTDRLPGCCEARDIPASHIFVLRRLRMTHQDLMLDEPALRIKTTPLTAWLPLMSQATNHLFPPAS